jgi:type IV secretory pathway protease TraF
LQQESEDLLQARGMEFVDCSMKLLGLVSPKMLTKFRINISQLAPLKIYKQNHAEIPLKKKRKLKLVKLPRIDSVQVVNQSAA